MYRNSMTYMNPMYMKTPMTMGAPEMEDKYARAYVLRQPFVGILPLNVALKRGTIFPNINVNFPRK